MITPSSSSPSSSSRPPPGDDDDLKIPWTSSDFSEMSKVGGASEYERRHRPYAKPRTLPPSLAEQWAYAARRYSKYQGYAWTGVVVVAGAAYLGSYLTTSDKKTPTKE